MDDVRAHQKINIAPPTIDLRSFIATVLGHQGVKATEISHCNAAQRHGVRA